MKYSFLLLLFTMSVAVSSASSCQKRGIQVFETNNTENYNNENIMSSKIKITVNSRTFSATLLDNNSANAFRKMLPMTINMTELNGNEKYFDLPKNLPTNSSNPRTIQNGDLMLFGSKTLVLFYKTSQTSYSYTRLGRIEDVAGLASALGSGDVTVTIEME